MKYDDSGLYVPRSVRSRAQPPMHVLFREDGRAWPPGMWNDGQGDAYRDCDIMFAGMPTYRLHTQNTFTSGKVDPGRTAATTGVVFKRRIQDGFTGVFALEMWFRFTSTGNNGVHNPLFSLSVYNRTGTDAGDGTSMAYHSRLWIDPNGNNQDLVISVLDGAATAAANGANALVGTAPAVWAQVGTSPMQNGAGTHNFDPSAGSGRLDRAGGWHYAYLASDLKTKKYVSCRIDGQDNIDLSAYSLDATSTTGAAMMHFSVEYTGSTSTDRFMNIAGVTGYGS